MIFFSFRKYVKMFWVKIFYYKEMELKPLDYYLQSYQDSTISKDSTSKLLKIHSIVFKLVNMEYTKVFSFQLF